MNKTFLTAALAALSLAASAATPDAGRPLWLRDVQISPDGKLAAFCYKGDIYVVSTQGGDARALTSQPSYECSPIWSPDGKTLAFASDRHGNFDVFTMPATESEATAAADAEMTSYTTPPSRSEEDLMDELTGQGHLFDDM